MWKPWVVSPDGIKRRSCTPMTVDRVQRGSMFLAFAPTKRSHSRAQSGQDRDFKGAYELWVLVFFHNDPVNLYPFSISVYNDFFGRAKGWLTGLICQPLRVLHFGELSSSRFQQWLRQRDLIRPSVVRFKCCFLFTPKFGEGWTLVDSYIFLCS